MGGMGDVLGLTPGGSALSVGVALPEKPAMFVKDAVDVIDAVGVAARLCEKPTEGVALALVDGVVPGGRLVLGVVEGEAATEALTVFDGVLDALAPFVRLAVGERLRLDAALALEVLDGVCDGL